MDIEAHIRGVMDEIMAGQEPMDRVSEKDMIEKLRKRGIVDDIMNNLQFCGTVPGEKPAVRFTDLENDISHGLVKKGKLFYDYIF